MMLEELTARRDYLLLRRIPIDIYMLLKYFIKDSKVRACSDGQKRQILHYAGDKILLGFEADLFWTVQIFIMPFSPLI